MTDDFLALMEDLHRDGARQGPGGDDQTRLAITLAGLVPDPGLRIADIGCGTGATARLLARDLGAQVTAVDFLPGFLDVLRAEAARNGLTDRITALEASMDALPFADGSLDAIWSEGAVYNMGFAKGVTAWRRFLKPDGILAVSELTWLTATRPAEIQEYWDAAYPEVDTAAAKIAVLERAGYAPLGYFPLPATCWTKNYLDPLAARLPDFLERSSQSEAARAIAAEQEAEADLYNRFGRYFGYGFYVAQRRD